MKLASCLGGLLKKTNKPGALYNIYLAEGGEVEEKILNRHPIKKGLKLLVLLHYISITTNTSYPHIVTILVMGVIVCCLRLF